MNVNAFENFRTNLRDTMQTRGISGKDLASTIGTSESYVCNLLKGKSVPSIDKCDRIADAVGVQLTKLLSRKTRKLEIPA